HPEGLAASTPRLPGCPLSPYTTLFRSAPYEPWESPVHNPLHPEQDRSPVAKHWDVDGNPYHGVSNPDYPYVLTTYRLTEHHTARSEEHTSELQSRENLVCRLLLEKQKR